MPFGPEARRRCSACNRVLSASNFSKHLRSCELYKAQQRRSQTLLLSCFPQAATNGDTSAIDDDVEEPDDESSHGLLKCPRFDRIGMGASAAEASALQAQHMPGPHTRSDHATGDLQLIEGHGRGGGDAAPHPAGKGGSASAQPYADVRPTTEHSPQPVSRDHLRQGERRDRTSSECDSGDEQLVEQLEQSPSSALLGDTDECGAPLLQNPPDSGTLRQPTFFGSFTRPAQISSKQALLHLCTQVQHLTVTLLKLPQDVARGIPRAVEEHNANVLARTQAAREASTLSARVGVCTSPEMICDVRGINFRIDHPENLLICNDCAQHVVFDRVATEKAVGQFKIDRKHFSKLKSRVLSHIAGTVHQHAVLQAAQLRKLESSNQIAGRNCARRVLTVVLENQSYQAYERMLATAQLEGVEVGTLNHSAAFARAFVHSMHAAIVSGIESLLKSPDPATGMLPAFALVADKATCGRHTGQMVGLVVMIRGVKTALLLGIDVVRAALVEGESTSLAPGSGRNLAYQLIGAIMGGKPLRLSEDNVREQLTSFGFDGQYMGPEQGNNSGLDAGGRMCKLLEMRTSFVVRKWDGAHLLELAVGDARKLPILLWWAELHVLISGVQAKYLYGKGFDRIFLAAAREMHVRGRADLQTAQRNEPSSAGACASSLHSAHAAHARGTASAPATESELPGNLGDGQWMVETILEQRATRGGGHEYLVKWTGWDEVHNSWVAEADIDPSLVRDFDRRSVADIVANGISASATSVRVASARPAADQAAPREHSIVAPVQQAESHAGSMSTRTRGQWRRLAALYHFCETRMAQSERKVYKNFLRNLHLVVDDMQSHGADANDVGKARSLVTVVRLMGAIDILRHVKDQSLYEQKVNSLVWEVDHAALAFVALLRQLADDLRKGDVMRTLPSRLPALEFLCCNIGKLKECKLQLIPEHKLITLALPSQLRLSASYRRAFPAIAGESTADETARAIMFALRGLTDMAEQIAVNFERRQHQSRPDQVAAMAGCLDLVQMASSTERGAAYRAAAPAHLRTLARWARPPVARPGIFLSAPCTELHGITLPADDVLLREFHTLCAAIQASALQPLYSERWRSAKSSTVLMRDVFSQPKFYERCPAYLYLFQHCALKGSPEAVVEGMGGVWDRCAEPGRHLSFEAGVQEAVVCWNAPRPHDEACDAFLDRALSLHFKGAKPHFTHTSATSVTKSKVVQKIQGVPSRLPGHLWKV